MKNCPSCGKEVGAEAVQGLCPACLMQVGLGSGPAPAAMDLPPLEELRARFPQLEIFELIGKGGMGAVYKARQKQLDRIVALKILPPGAERDAAFAARFTTEARALARLNHPNIVTIHDFGCVTSADALPSSPDTRPSPLFFFVMEFVDGMNLRQLLNAGRIAPREALAIVPQICDALQYAHDHGIVHRDIKPENILLDRQGRVKVADFGLAKLVGASSSSDPSDPSDRSDLQAHVNTTEAGVVLGTPQYMAPEQREHPTDVDHRADIYSLGVVFYQMLTGELPKGDFAAPSKKVLLDIRLDAVVLRALEKTPGLRFQQVSEVKTLVETIATTPAPASPPISSAGIGGASVREQPGMIAKFLLFSSIVGVRNGRRVINWAGARSNGILFMGVMAVVFVPLVFSGEHISGWLVSLNLFVLGMIVASAVRDCRKPIEQLPSLDSARGGQSLENSTGTPSAGGRIAYVLFALLYLGSLVCVALSAPWLPERVATHFGFEGAADGWMTRTCYLAFVTVLPLLLALFFAGIAALIKVLPVRFVNIPNRDYWLAPERRVATAVLARHWLAGLLCLLTLFFAALHTLTVQANRITPPHLPMGGLLLLVIVFLLALMIWLTLFLMRFAEIRAVEQSGAPASASRETLGRRLKRFLCVTLPVALVIALVIRTFLLQTFVAATDAAAPEIPRGSHFLAWKIVGELSPGDLVCYRQNDLVVLGRVARVETGRLIVRSNVTPEIPVPRADVVGKVISVYWRASAGAAPEAASSGAAFTQNGMRIGLLILIALGVAVATLVGALRKRARPQLPSLGRNDMPAFPLDAARDRPLDSARGGQALEKTVRAKRYGKFALALCLGGLALPVLLLAFGLPLHSRLGALQWLGVFGITSLCEIAAIVLGILGWKSGAGKAAVIIAAVLPLLAVPGTALFWLSARAAHITTVKTSAENQQRAAVKEHFNDRLTHEIHQHLRQDNIHFKKLVVTLADDLTRADIRLEGLTKRKYPTDASEQAIEGKLVAESTGLGSWEIRGQGRLESIRFSVSVPIIERMISSATDGAKPRAQAVFAGEREELEKMLRVAFVLWLNERGVSYADVRVNSAQDLTSAKVNYSGLQGLKRTDGTQVFGAAGSGLFDLKVRGESEWAGTLTPGVLVELHPYATGTVGLVVDGEGRPIPDVLLRQQDSSWQATTDANGRFPLPALTNNQQISLTLQAHGFAKRDNVSLFRDSAGWSVQPVRYMLRRTARLSGRVLAPSGKPLAYAPLSLMTCYGPYRDGDRTGGFRSSSASGTTANALRAITDDQGNWHVEDVPSGCHILYYPWEGPTQDEVEQERWRALKLAGREVPLKDICGALVVETRDGQQVDGVVLDLARSTCRITGRVLDQHGQPVVGAKLDLFRRAEKDDGTGKVTFGAGLTGNAGAYTIPSTDAGGHYEIRNCPPGDWSVRVCHGKAETSGELRLTAAGEHATLDLCLTREAPKAAASTKPGPGKKTAPAAAAAR